MSKIHNGWQCIITNITHVVKSKRNIIEEIQVKKKITMANYI